MKLPCPTRINPAPDGHGTDLGKARPGRQTGRRVRHNEAVLEIAADALPDEAIRGLLDDWIIPMVVEDIMQKQLGGARLDSL